MDLGHLSVVGQNELVTFLYLFFGKIELITRLERTKEGIARAKLDKKYKGRQSVIKKETIKRVEQLLQKGITKKEIALLLNISKSSVYKIIRIINLEKAN